MSNYFEKVAETKKFLESKIKTRPEIMIVLSGGHKEILKHIKEPQTINASEIPNFPVATAEGHSGNLVFGEIGGKKVVVFFGRFHYYEGHKISDVVFPLFAMNAFGAKTLVASNATGGINKDFKSGDIMMIKDHINYMGVNPLVGIATQRKEDQFTDMTNAYSKHLQEVARKAAKETGLDLKEGTYLAVSGPNYETPAEIRMMRGFGADAVSMSMVPEIISANFLKMNTLAFSCIANPAADLHQGGMNHHEVLESMKKMEEKLLDLLLKIIPNL